MKKFLFFTLLVLLFVGCSKDHQSDETSFPQKVAIIDAGSSGSRLYIYEVKADSTVKLLYPVSDQEKKESKGRAISTVANHPDSVRAYYDGMTLSYKSGNENIPLYILATAGMRVQDQATADGVYNKLRAIGEANGFSLKAAMTIAGRYEGLYAWIATNYENGTLTNSPKGIIEVGGVSAQLAFSSKTLDIPDDNKIVRQGWGTIYSKSYLGGGLNWVYEHTEDKEPFAFSVPLEDVSAYYRDNMTFFGCSTPLNVALTGIQKTGSFEAYVGTLPRTDKYHLYMFAYYMQWLFEKLQLTGKVTLPANGAEWTEGAAYDIIINKQQPENYDYSKKL